MRSFIMCCIMLIPLLLPGFAAEHDAERPQTLLSGPVHHGFYFAPVTKISRIDGETALLAGGKMAWLINHRFAIGFAGYGRIDDLGWNWDCDWDRNWKRNIDSTQMGYGGLYLESVFSPLNVLRISGAVLIGAGALLTPEIGIFVQEECSIRSGNCIRRDVDVFFAFEPEINLEAGITRYFTLGLGLSYRFVSGVDELRSSNGRMSGPSAALTLKFGRL